MSIAGECACVDPTACGPQAAVRSGTTPTSAPDGGQVDDAREEATRFAALVQATYRDARGFEADFVQTRHDRRLARIAARHKT